MADIEGKMAVAVGKLDLYLKEREEREREMTTILHSGSESLPVHFQGSTYLGPPSITPNHLMLSQDIYGHGTVNNTKVC